jgi:hypothetical protein
MKSTSTRTLLSFGIAGAIMFPLLTAIQASVRQGFSLAAHPFGLLSLGAFGWIQILNFVVSGLFFLLFAVGIQRALNPTSFWIPLLFKAYGLLTILDGIFVLDPVLGFPPGTPAGVPETLSWHATAHYLIWLAVFLCIVLVEFIFSRRFAKEKKWGWFAYSLLIALAATVLLVASGEPGSPYFGAMLFTLNLITNTWIVAIALLFMNIANLKGTYTGKSYSPAYSSATKTKP